MNNYIPRVYQRLLDDRGSVNSVNLLVLGIVVPALLIAVFLLTSTMLTANSINAKAARIAETGRGINSATDSVLQLTETNKTASAILEKTGPLEGKLAEIVALASTLDQSAASINSTAGSIDGSAGKINSTAGAINATAGTINKTAGTIDATAGKIMGTAGKIDATAGAINGTGKGINTSAASILRSLQGIDKDVEQVNANLDVALGVANAVKGDTGNILAQAEAAHQNAACIDRKLGGASDNHCR